MQHLLSSRAYSESAMTPDEDNNKSRQEASDWGVTVSNNPDLSLFQSARAAGRRLWKNRDSLF